MAADSAVAAVVPAATWVAAPVAAAPRPRTTRGAARQRRDRFPAAPEKPIKTRKCVFCSKKGQEIDYKDTALLRTYISERGKIRARRVTGNCVQHQRDIAIAVKNAREVALLPFSSSTR